MPKLSIAKLILFTGKSRVHIMEKLDGLPFEKKGSAKCYEAKHALTRIYLGTAGETGAPTEAESRRLLNIKRTASLELDMQVKRRERIPLDVIEAGYDRVFGNVAGMIKAQRGKVMTEEAINDLFTELRGLSEVIAP